MRLMDDLAVQPRSISAPKLDPCELRLARDRLATLRDLVHGTLCRIERSVEAIETSRELLAKLQQKEIQLTLNGERSPVPREKA
jgi:hypothetical protein